MSIVKINAVTVPPDKQARFEERFRGRAGAVEKTPGFEWFELLRPLEGTDQYLVYTRWTSEEAYLAWQNEQNFDRAHDGGGRHPRAGGGRLPPPVVLRGAGVRRPARGPGRPALTRRAVVVGAAAPATAAG